MPHGVPGDGLVVAEQGVGDARAGAEIFGHDKWRVVTCRDQGGRLAGRQHGQCRGFPDPGLVEHVEVLDDQRRRVGVGPARLDPLDLRPLTGAQRLERAQPDVRQQLPHRVEIVVHGCGVPTLVRST